MHIIIQALQTIVLLYGKLWHKFINYGSVLTQSTDYDMFSKLL